MPWRHGLFPRTSAVSVNTVSIYQLCFRTLLKVNVEAAALLVRCNAYAAQTLLSLAAGFINYAQFYSYRRVRPQVHLHSVSCQGREADF